MAQNAALDTLIVDVSSIRAAEVHDLMPFGHRDELRVAP
jgi:hypothetical protein